jgi:hypothetical protein
MNYPDEKDNLEIVAVYHFLKFQGYQMEFLGFPT